MSLQPNQEVGILDGLSLSILKCNPFTVKCKSDEEISRFLKEIDVQVEDYEDKPTFSKINIDSFIQNTYIRTLNSKLSLNSWTEVHIGIQIEPQFDDRGSHKYSSFSSFRLKQSMELFSRRKRAGVPLNVFLVLVF